jgi:hypothetical protein
MTDHIESTDDGASETADQGEQGGDEGSPPEAVIEEAERLTRLAREAVDDDEAAAYRAERADLLATHDYTDRIREESDGDVLVLYPEEWVEDGLVQTDRIEDIDRGIEVSLEGPGDPEEWSDVADHNRAIVEQVREEHGEVHGDNAEAFAEFLSNHYAKPIEGATAAEKETFLAEYFPRNAWPTEEQRVVIEESLSLTFDVAASVSDTPE